MIFINFKTYLQGTGQSAVDLVKSLTELAENTHVKLIPVVQAADLKEITATTTLEVWAQHTDPVTYGAHTGSVLPEAVIEDGAQGTFLNHSEHKFANFNDLTAANSRAQELGLKTLIFASDLPELKLILKLKPTFVSYEPPELIGSSTKSVASEEPSIIKKASDIARGESIPLIVGAGIHSREDIKTSLELGASGFAIASDIMKAEDPVAELKELIEGYN